MSPSEYLTYPLIRGASAGFIRLCVPCLFGFRLVSLRFSRRAVQARRLKGGLAGREPPASLPAAARLFPIRPLRPGRIAVATSTFLPEYRKSPLTRERGPQQTWMSLPPKEAGRSEPSALSYALRFPLATPPRFFSRPLLRRVVLSQAIRKWLGRSCSYGARLRLRSLVRPSLPAKAATLCLRLRSARSQGEPKFLPPQTPPSSWRAKIRKGGFYLEGGETSPSPY